MAEASELSKRQLSKRQLYVSNLPPRLGDDRLRQFFARVGKLSDGFIPTGKRFGCPPTAPGGRPECGRFITYVNAEDATKALALDGQYIDDAMYTSEQYISPDPIKVTRARVKPRENESQGAPAGDYELSLDGRAARVQPHIFVSNLPAGSNDDHLYHAFSQIGSIDLAYVPKGKRFGFVTFVDEADASKALSMDGSPLDEHNAAKMRVVLALDGAVPEQEQAYVSVALKPSPVALNQTTSQLPRSRRRSISQPDASAAPPCYVRPGSLRGRQAVTIGNEQIRATVLLGGGHIGLIQRASDASTEEDDFGSPLWVPPWPTFDPAVAEAVDEQIFGPGLEGKYVLQHIMGHNLCLDVFGEHSAGEVAKSGLAFHGEAGQVSWTVSQVARADSSCSMTLTAHLRRSCLEVSRQFSLAAGSSTVQVHESVTNLTGFERALGRAQHVTIGAAWLGSHKLQFSCNADCGQTWPEPLGEHASFAPDERFDYPTLPGPDGTTVDWRSYPQKPQSEGLCTLRISPAERLGWMCVQHTGKQQELIYAWERESFPWLVDWQENCARQDKPWNGRTLTRGLEFSSYAFPLGRRWNVEQGKLLETPCFEWLDAHQTKSTTFCFSLQPIGQRGEDPECSPLDRIDIPPTHKPA